jgi:hypothetical protein
MKIKSINIIDGKNKWSESKDKIIHMVLDLGVYENKPSDKIDGFYERIKEYLPSLKSHRCSEGKPGGFFKRIKDGTWMGHIIEHVALELQTLAGMNTGWGRTRGVKGQKGVYNVVFNYENKDSGKLAAREAFNVVNDIINDRDPEIDRIVKKLKPKNLKESIRRILREEINPFKVSDPSTRIEEDRVQIRLGRNKENHFGKIQNIIIMVDDQDITSENNVPDLGQMNIVINDGEIYVGDIVIPEKYRGQGIATIVYQKISDYFGLPIVNSKTKGRNQLDQGGQIWKNREKFEPRNLQEHIIRILREETKIKPILNNMLNMLFDGFDDIYYDWAQYNCGMGICCDPYAVGFVLPTNNHDDYLFKLVDGNNYDDDGDYPKELRDELPEVCYEMPDVKNPNFNFIIFYEEFAEEIEDYLGHKKNWKFKLLDLINEKFGCKATNIIFI